MISLLESYGVWIPILLSTIGVREPAPVELNAKIWIQKQSIRIPEDRTYLLFFFTTFQPKETQPYLARLNRLHARKDTIVVGLCAESGEKVKKFIQKEKIRFSVGAGSPSYKRFNIKKFPQLIVLSPQGVDQDAVQAVPSIEWLDLRFPDESDYPTLESGAFDEHSPVELLKRHGREDSAVDDRRRAVRLLRDRLAADEFMRYCDELLQDPKNRFTPSMNGFISYSKHLADPNSPVKEPLLAGSTQARRDMDADPVDSRWEEVKDYYERIGDRTADELLSDFHDHLSDKPANLLIRHQIARSMERLVHEGQADPDVAQEYLMQMFPLEADPANRQRIVGAIGMISKPGDFSCADFLEAQLRTESNIRSVRPVLEYTIRYLRTGEE